MIDNFEKNKWLIRGVLGFLVLLFGIAFVSLTAKAEMVPHESGCAAYTEGLDEAYAEELKRLENILERGGRIIGSPTTIYSVKSPKAVKMNGVSVKNVQGIFYTDGDPVVGVLVVPGQDDDSHLTFSCFTPMPVMPEVEGGQLTVIDVLPNT